MNLQTMKQRAVAILADNARTIPLAYDVQQVIEELTEENTTQTYRDTLNIALAGIVDRDIPELCRNWQSQLAYHEAISYNQANATTRAFFQGLLDDIKD